MISRKFRFIDKICIPTDKVSIYSDVQEGTMNHKRNLTVVLLLVFLLFGSAPELGGKADQVTYTTVDLTPTWTTGVISDYAGGARIMTADLDNDGKVEIASCSNGYAFALRATEDDAYRTIWYSENIGCNKITSADRDSNGVRELYVAASNGMVWIIDGASFQILGTFTAIPNLGISDIAVADVDGDGGHEIVLVRPEVTLVYDANGYSLEWEASGLGGDEVAIDNIDTDPLPEIIVNGYPAHVLNASLKIEEWVKSTGFGTRMSVGDVDNDNIAEIAYIYLYDLYVMDGDTQVIKWEINDFVISLSSIAVADVDGDGICEVVTGDSQWGSIKGYRGSDGGELWVIPNPEYGSGGITVADVNDDGVNEILWGAGMTSYGNDAIFIGDWQSETVVWRSEYLDGPLFVAAGDVDNDRDGEIVVASRGVSHYSIYDCIINVYDGETQALEWSTVSTNFQILQLAVGQVDSDLPLEILIGGGSDWEQQLQSYDGKTGLLEWHSEDMDGPVGLAVMNIDADPIEEVFVALWTKNVQVYEGASDILLWDSGVLDGYIQDIAVGDLDGDTIAELAVVTGQSIYVYEVGTWTEKLHRQFANGVEVAITEADLNGGGELLLATSSTSASETLQALDGVSFTVNWNYLIGEAVISELASIDVDQDGIQEYILMGTEGISIDPKSLLWIGSRGLPQLWEYKNPGRWGNINSMAVYDVDNDDAEEFLFGSSYLFQLNEQVITSRIANRAYLPFLKRACIPLYADDFSNPASGWPIANTDTALFEYNNGEYRILVRPTDWGAAVRPGIQVSDYILGVDLRNPGNLYGSYGLAFGIAADWSSLYTLEIYPHGWYGIYRFDPSQVVTLTTAFSPAINQGTASNHIEIQRNGNLIKAYANGQLLASIADGTYLGSRYVGLAVFSYYQPNVDIRFDNFVIKPISCSGSMATVEDLEELILPFDQSLVDFDMLSTDLSRDR